MPKKQSDATFRILVADDSEVCRGVLVILLETAGYTVVSVHDGREAVKTLRKHTFDLAILDNDMPNLNGLGTLSELRTFLPQLPVLVCSGTVTPDQAMQYYEQGIEELMRKPVDPMALRNRVADILSRIPVGARIASGDNTGSDLPDSVVNLTQRSPLTAGPSPEAVRLQTDLRRLGRFRSVAIVEGGPGSGRFELAFYSAPDEGVHRLVCHAEDVSESRLISLLKPSLDNELPVLLIILDSDSLSIELQALLEALVRGKIKELSGLFKRLRLVLCAHRSLNDLHFNEFLLLRAIATTCVVPDFSARRQDWSAVARAILWRSSNGRCSFSNDAIKWIEGREWTGDYIQMHRTIELARRRAGLVTTIRTAHLVAAYSREPTCQEPLFHDLIFILNSGEEPVVEA